MGWFRKKKKTGDVHNLPDGWNYDRVQHPTPESFESDEESRNTWYRKEPSKEQTDRFLKKSVMPERDDTGGNGRDSLDEEYVQHEFNTSQRGSLPKPEATPDETVLDTPALSILKIRYASGEITKKEFEEMKKDIDE